MTPAAMILVKVSLLLAAAFVARRMLRTGPAARRHGVWTAMFVAILALPLLVVADPLPPLDVPLLFGSTGDTSFVTAPTMTAATGPAMAARAAERSPVMPSTPKNLRVESPAMQRPSLSTTLLGTWLLGAIVAAIAVLVSFARARRLARSGIELNDETWRAARARIASRLRYSRTVRIIACDGIRTPMAGGLLRAIVFVPAGASQWDDQRRHIVLAHEIAHHASGDPLRHFVSRVACILYWFHPLVWLAVRESAADCEQACDERVLSLGVRPSTYADLLLDFTAGPLVNPKALIAMVRRDRLEERLMSILDNRPRPVVKRTLVPAMIAVALTLSLAAARPVAWSAAAVGSASVDVQTPPAVASVPAVAQKVIAPTPLASKAIEPVVVTTPPSQPAMLVAAPECWGAEDRSRSFSGQMNTNGGKIVEQIGRRGSERVAQTHFGDLYVCVVTAGFAGGRDDRPSRWPLRSDRVILETRMPNDVRTLELNNARSTYTVNGTMRPLDAAAREWRDNLLALLDVTWDLGELRGRVSSLRGEISSIQGERSSLQGQISSYRGQVSSMTGEISSLRGQVSSMTGEIASIRGHESSLRGQISSELGAISTLRGMSWEGARGIDVDARIRGHAENIQRLERQIRDYDAESRVREIERRIDMFDVETKVAGVERRIREFDVEAKVARIQRRLDELEVDNRVSGIEADIRSIDVPGRSRDLEERRDEALAKLRRTLP